MKKAYHIAVEGSIGVGKTSLSKILSEKLKCKLVLEEFEENPFLAEFYKDPDRIAHKVLADRMGKRDPGVRRCDSERRAGLKWIVRRRIENRETSLPDLLRRSGLAR